MNPDGEHTPYDDVLYPSYTHTLSHPDVLAKQAMLFGIEPVPPDRCRVLELGCGDGSNVIPMAYGLPGSRFTGIDLAGGPVERGRELISATGLGNVRLIHGDLMDFPADAGEFDYIIAHGLYSWVPEPVREKILAICGKHLSPGGVAFISYLAYPGAHARAMLRDMLLFHTRNCQVPGDTVDAAKDLAGMVANVPPANDLVRFLLQSECRRLMDMVPGHLYHDDLAEWNAAFYLVQFTTAAAGYGLEFLAEADFTEMQDQQFPPELREKLARIAPDKVLREQYLDFFRGRRFRQTLLCRTGQSTTPAPDPACLDRLFLSSDATTEHSPVDLSPEVDITFHSQKNTTLESRHPPGKAALAVLMNAWPNRLSFAALATATRALLEQAGCLHGTTSEFNDRLMKFLLHLHGAGMIHLHAHPSRQCPAPCEHPQASPVALWQAARGHFATSLRHVGYTFKEDLAIHIFRLLDGKRDRPAITRALLSNPEALSILLACQIPTDAGSDVLAGVIDREIDHLAWLGLLIA